MHRKISLCFGNHLLPLCAFLLAGEVVFRGKYIIIFAMLIFLFTLFFHFYIVMISTFFVLLLLLLFYFWFSYIHYLFLFTLQHKTVLEYLHNITMHKTSDDNRRICITAPNSLQRKITCWKKILTKPRNCVNDLTLSYSILNLQLCAILTFTPLFLFFLILFLLLLPPSSYPTGENNSSYPST